MDATEDINTVLMTSMINSSLPKDTFTPDALNNADITISKKIAPNRKTSHPLNPTVNNCAVLVMYSTRCA